MMDVSRPLFDIPRGRVFDVGFVEIERHAGPHPFERAHGEAIAANWQHEVGKSPKLFNGRVMLLGALRHEDGGLRGHCHEVDYAAFMYWRTLRPHPAAEHIFAHAVLVAEDETVVAIRMRQGTVNAGLVYCAAGSFEPGDIRNGRIDVARNMAREVEEETGLDIAGLAGEPAYHAYAAPTGTVIFRRYGLRGTGTEIARVIADNVARQSDPEIEGPVVLTQENRHEFAYPPHMPALLDWHFSRPMCGAEPA
jgi:8-oxo-dGTP pyrophosphatase MutT (NUDIX family)